MELLEETKRANDSEDDTEETRKRKEEREEQPESPPKLAVDAGGDVSVDLKGPSRRRQGGSQKRKRRGNS